MSATSDEPMLHPESAAGAPRGKSKAMRWVFYILALALFGACIWFGYAEIRKGWDKLLHASRADLLIMGGAIIANMVLDGVVFWMLVLPFRPARPVLLREMVALIAASSLLNFLPMRAGMVGRAVYLKQRHGVAYNASVVMLGGMAAATMAIYAVLSVLTLWRGRLDSAWWALFLASLLVMSWAGLFMLRHWDVWMPRRLRPYFVESRATIERLEVNRLASLMGTWAMLVVRGGGIGARVLLVWTAARVIGSPIELPAAVVIAVCGTFVSLVTPLPNGLGLREWLYGALAALGLAGGTLLTKEGGLALGFTERAVEVVVFLVFGTVAIGYIHRRASRAIT